MTAVPAALDEDGNKDGYESPERHELLGADGRGRGRLGARRPAEPDAGPGQPGDPAVGRDLAPAGWDPNTGFGLLSVARRADHHAAAGRPGRAQRRHRLGRRARVRQAATALFYKGTGHRRLQGLLDAFEDPADVYRIRIRAHSHKRITREPDRQRRRRAVRLPRAKPSG